MGCCLTVCMCVCQVVDGLLEQTPQLTPDSEPVALRLRDSHLLVLRALQEPRCYGPQWVQKHVTR